MKSIAGHTIPGLDWKQLPQTDPYLRQYRYKDGDLVVIESSADHPLDDGEEWYHVSCSRGKRLPDYEDMKRVKHDFVGPHREAVEVHARESEHVNINEHVRHLWCCLSNDHQWPQFGRFGTI